MVVVTVAVVVVIVVVRVHSWFARYVPYEDHCCESNINKEKPSFLTYGTSHFGLLATAGIKLPLFA